VISRASRKALLARKHTHTRTKICQQDYKSTSLQVTCINKTDRQSAHERIINTGGSNWKHTEDDAIYYIENGAYSYYVNRGGCQVNVIVAERLGRKYLKTENDREEPDEPLALPECS
jgi:hypothetical protein